MLVWLFQSGEPLPVDGAWARPMRAINLSNALVRRGHTVVLWSSRFNHTTKVQRTTDRESVLSSGNLTVRLIESPGYQRNIGIGRAVDHAALGRNLAASLRGYEAVPDVAVVGYPPIETAFSMVRTMRTRGIPVLVDVKDQWPHYYLGVLPPPVRPIGRVAFDPYFRLGRKALRSAAGITTMSESYLEWSLAFAGRSRRDSDALFPLTSAPPTLTDQDRADASAFWDGLQVRDDGRYRVFFVGTFMASAFDFRPVVEAVRRLDVQFVLCGTGPAQAEVQSALRGQPNVVFPGWVSSAQIELLGERSTVALAPYVKIPNFEMNVTNKVVDALRLGLPVLTPLNGETGSLLESSGAGICYGASPRVSLAEALEGLAADECRRTSRREAARALYADRFDADVVYSNFAIHLERVAAGNSRS